MANDPVLVERVRDLAPIDMMEKNVFGARCWVLDGNMAFGVHEDALLVRLGPDATDGQERDLIAALTPFDPVGRGKPMAGWFLVGQDDLAEDADVAAWIGRAAAFVQTLPAK